MIIAFAVWSIVAVLLSLIGISSKHSQKPVSFFTFAKPPLVDDIDRYNRAVAELWSVSALIFELIGVPLLFLEQNSPAFLVLVFGVLAWSLGIMLAYVRIEARYKKDL